MDKATDASGNTAIGKEALRENLSGEGNALPSGSRRSRTTRATGTWPSADKALYGSRAGSGNIALGDQVGRDNASGSNNVYIGNRAEDGESEVIRIGDPNTHTRTILVGEVEGDINVVPVYQ